MEEKEVQELALQYFEHGYVVVRQVWDKAQIAHLQAQMEDTLESMTARSSQTAAWVERGKGRLDLNVSRRWNLEHEFLYPSRLMPLLNKLFQEPAQDKKATGDISPPTEFYNLTQNLIVAQAGAKKQKWHTDVSPLFQTLNTYDLDTMKETFYVTLWSPFRSMQSGADGPLEVKDKQDPSRSVVLTQLEIGDVVLLDGLAEHRGLGFQPNSKEEVRPAIYFAFAKHWFRDHNASLSSSSSFI